MTEYITKAQALEAVHGKMWPGEIEAAIKAIPAADVVGVVRCKDCADFRPWGGQSKLGDCWFMFATARIRSLWKKLTFAAMEIERTVTNNENNPR